MVKDAKLVGITLTEEEAAVLLVPMGQGGQQGFHKLILERLDHGSLTLTFSDEELGKLFRYMTQYGRGGFQGRLRKAFHRPLMDCFQRRSIDYLLISFGEDFGQTAQGKVFVAT